MSSRTSENPIITTLSFAQVAHGGNTGAGKYFYNFDPDIQTMCKGQKDVVLIYQLDSSVAYHFRIASTVVNDPKFQIRDVTVATDGRSVSMINANTEPCLIFMSVLIRDERTNALINCDPQVGNDPEVPPQAQ